jgi:hypothetical protein
VSLWCGAALGVAATLLFQCLRRRRDARYMREADAAVSGATWQQTMCGWAACRLSQARAAPAKLLTDKAGVHAVHAC